MSFLPPLSQQAFPSGSPVVLQTWSLPSDCSESLARTIPPPPPLCIFINLISSLKCLTQHLICLEFLFRDQTGCLLVEPSFVRDAIVVSSFPLCYTLLEVETKD